MKSYMTVAAICGCLLIGSLYPRMILNHHMKLVDDQGMEIITEIKEEEKIPVKLELRLLEFFR